MQLEFFFDYGSPYSYLADTQLDGLRQRTGCEVVYRPMLLGGVFKAVGNRSPMVEPVEPKRAYFGLELQRFVKHYSAEFAPNPHFPINTLLVMRCAHAARELGVFEKFHRAVYPAFWARSLDLGSPEVIAEVAEAAGLDGGAIIEAAGRPRAKEGLRTTTDEAVGRGVFGAPTFFVGDEMYFGADRMPFVEAALAGA